MYYRVRQMLRWFCEKTGQQCSGKYKPGYGLVWCQKRAFHDGACVDYSRREFPAPQDKPVNMNPQASLVDAERLLGIRLVAAKSDGSMSLDPPFGWVAARDNFGNACYVNVDYEGRLTEIGATKSSERSKVIFKFKTKE